MHHEFLGDLFEEEVRSAGKAFMAIGAVGYFAAQAENSTLFKRDEVQYAIDAYLPQGYDRSVIAARSNQLLTKSFMMKALRIDSVKEEMRLAANREEKLSCLADLFQLTLVGMLSAAHVHSLTIVLHVIRNTALILVYVLGKREESGGSRGRAMVSKVRSWWSGGMKSVMLESIVERIQQDMGGSPFAQVVDEENVVAADIERWFSVEALLQIAVPRVVESARRVVKTALNRRAPHVFSVAGIVTGQDMHMLLEEISEDFESCVAWSDWLTPPPPAPESGNGLGGSIGGKGVVVVEPISDDDDDDDDDESGILEFPMGSTALPRDHSAASRRQRDRNVVASVFGLPGDESPAEAAAREAERRRETLLRDQASGFFHAIIHSDSFNEICIAYAAEVLEGATAAAADLRHVRTYDEGTDSARMPQVITSLESHRLSLFDHDFNVRPYLRLLCEETIRATCRLS
ncbi:hypothetical protein DQ04_08871000 [Trypanosoma grayi]|uniref:hypothetical protein n=1 Tax=Trypanosoma grayi TaxID=71804 RepID=UPI0004F474B7|nr:hypothetical protein DQ04_08871000 [Trypanosoma grayi]KEG07770.1 hypothetical protein DQ04_08871000 [Trypanosoma grayi]